MCAAAETAVDDGNAAAAVAVFASLPTMLL